MRLSEQLTLGLVIDIVFGLIVVAASSVAPNLTGWAILAVASVALVWVWARVVYRIRTTETQAKEGASGTNSAV